MSATVTIEVLNEERLDSLLARLNEMELEAVRPVVENAVGQMVETAQGLVPIGETGNLQKSIHIEGEYPFIMFVADAVNKQGDGYAVYVEEGTSKMQAQPFMRPAVDAEMVDLIPTLRMVLRNFLREE